uniref:ubiquitinyl hydrolase 1 n=1 Tax=Panagrolaimus davidi TaxID=227884 RepID=A0A914QPM6_9BILA
MSEVQIYLLQKIKDRCAQFKGYTQQDAQEFIRCFLDVLHQELRHPITPILDGNNKEDEKQLESRNSVSSSCSSSQDELNGAQGDHFETADSGLSSDTGEPSKKSKLTVGIPLLPAVQEKQQIAAAKTREQKAQEKNHTQFRSIITDVFDGEIISTVKCMTCQHLSNTRETFQDISLSIPTIEQIAILRESSTLDFEASEEELNNKKVEEQKEELEEIKDEQQPSKQESFALRISHNSYAYWAYAIAKSWLIDPWLSYLIYFYRFMFAENISLEDCLYAFFSADHLHGDDMYSCEKCSKLRNGVKQCRLTRLPEILCIHLKRFRHEYTYNTKVGTRVVFPLCDLDMKPFMLKSALEQAEQEDKSTLYDLVAFVSHRGAGVEFGHYVAYCYNSIDGNWYEYDDASVTRVDEADVLSREAYVLFYQKRSTEASENFKEKVLELSATLNETESLNAFYISAEWLYRFRTFSEPGPITNNDFLCEHFGQAPLLQPNQVFPIPSKVWSLLFEQYGGGPPCDRLMQCNTCNNRVTEIISRKTREKNVYLSLEKKLRYVTVLPPNVLAYSWYEQWESFVTQFDRAPPGNIRNDALLQKQRDGSMRLRSGINYKSITHEQWTYLHSIYGGGPEVLRTFDKQPSAEEIQTIVQRFEEQLAAAARKAKEPIVELPSSDNEEEDSNTVVKEENDTKVEEETESKVEDEGMESISNTSLPTDLKLEEKPEIVQEESDTV